MPAVLRLTKKAASPVKANGLNTLCALGERTKDSTSAGKTCAFNQKLSGLPSAALLLIIAQAIAPASKRKAIGGAAQW